MRDDVMLQAIRQLIAMFAAKTADRSTLDQLLAMTNDSGSWNKAHDLFQRIRDKNLDAIRKHNRKLEAQYCFEEVCAKTLYNLTDSDAPFDADSPYWIVPNALSAARHLQIDEKEITKAVVA